MAYSSLVREPVVDAQSGLRVSQLLEKHFVAFVDLAHFVLPHDVVETHEHFAGRGGLLAAALRLSVLKR